MKLCDGGSRGRLVALLAATALATFGPGAGGVARAAADCAPVVHLTGGVPGDLTAITSVSAAIRGNVWAIGRSYQSSTQAGTYSLLHWVGTEWQTQPSPEPNADLNGITTAGPGDIWIAANRKDPAGGATHALILYSNGSTWTTTALPEGTQGTSQAAVVRGWVPSDVWAVGSGIWHGLNGQWQAMEITDLPSLAKLNLTSLAVTGPNDAWAAGTMQEQGATTWQPVVLRWNGAIWYRTGAVPPGFIPRGGGTIPPNPDGVLPSGFVPLAVAALPAQVGVWAVGQGGSAHWDGQRWTAVPVPGLSSGRLTSIALDPGGDAWATAEGIPNPQLGDTQVAAIFHWDGKHWTLVPGPAPYMDTPLFGFRSLAVEGPGDVWAVGSQGEDMPGGSSHARIGHIFSPCGLPTGAVADPRAAGVRYFPEVQHTLRGPFRAYWEQHGGLAQFGYPITEEYEEPSATDGKIYRVQYFQRNRFEYHPENAGTPYEVLLGLLGRSVTKNLTAANPWFAALTTPPPGSTFFPQTGHTVAPEFLTYWQTHGNFAVYGYPISEPFVTDPVGTGMKPYITQYFERNRLEYHPDFPADYRVSLGLLGADLLHERGWLP